MRQSFFATALCLSLIQTSDARAHGRFPQLQIRDGGAVVQDARHGVVDWFRHLFKKDDSIERRQESICPEDIYFQFVYNSSFGQDFCESFVNYPNTTVTADYTPTSTSTDIFTTDVYTNTQVIRTTPITTVTETVTAGAKVKREPQITARAKLSQAQVVDVFAIFRRQQAGNSSSIGSISAGDQALSPSFSSACLCQTYGGSTITETYTDEPVVTTLLAFAVTTTTTVTTRTAIPLTSTVLVTLGANSSVAGTPSTDVGASTTVTASGAPTATAPSFSCPDDNNTTISQMVNNERFDYIVDCDTDLTDPTLYGSLYYCTFSACVAACSTNDYNLQSAACQGVSYYSTANEDGYNCFMKTSANGTVPATGVGSALLQRIAVGISNTSAAGTATEYLPFISETPTQNPSQLSSLISSMMGNSTSSMPMVTPGPPMPVSGMLVNADSYSTEISNGSTFSSGTAYYTSYSISGEWYVKSYTYFTEAWTSATTVYEISAQQTVISSSSDTSTTEESDDNGEYSDISITNSTTYYEGGYNVTEVISNTTYAANGTELSSTAVTSYYNYPTGSSGSESGTITVITPTPYTSTSVFSTETVIVNSGGTSGASGYEASGYVSGATPSTSVTTIVNTFGTAYSSGYFISGGESGTAYSSGYVASGYISSLPTSTSTAIIVNSAGTAYSSEFVASGYVSSLPTSTSTAIIVNSAGTAYSSEFVASGYVSSLPTSTSTAIIVNSAGTAYSSGYVASGYISSLPASTSTTIVVNPAGTAYSSGYVASGYVSSLPTSTSTAILLSSGGTAYSTGYVASGYVSSASGSISISTTIIGTGTPGGYSGASSSLLSGIIPSSGSSSPSYSFGGPSAPRIGPLSSSTLVGTTPGSPPIYTAPTSVSSGTAPSGTAPTPVSYGTAPSGTAPTSSPSFSFTEATVSRVGSGSSSIPLLTAPSYGTAPTPASSGTAPSGTAPTPVSYGTAPSGTAPTSSPSFSFSVATVSRVGSGSSSIPLLTAPSYSTGTPVIPTGPYPYPPFNNSPPANGTSTPLAPTASPTYFTALTGYPTAPISSGSPLPSVNSTTPSVPTGTVSTSYSFSQPAQPRSMYPPGTGTAPPVYPSFPTAPPTYFTALTGYPTAPPTYFTALTGYPTAPISSGSPLPSVNSTIPSVPTGTVSTSYSFSQPAQPRSMYPPGTGTAPPVYPSFPTAPATTCGNMTLATTTIYSTTTFYGCYETCIPQAGSYGAPLSFGPPVVNPPGQPTMR